jgi:hypothetical protein
MRREQGKGVKPASNLHLIKFKGCMETCNLETPQHFQYKINKSQPEFGIGIKNKTSETNEKKDVPY